MGSVLQPGAEDDGFDIGDVVGTIGQVATGINDGIGSIADQVANQVVPTGIRSPGIDESGPLSEIDLGDITGASGPSSSPLATAPGSSGGPSSSPLAGTEDVTGAGAVTPPAGGSTIPDDAEILIPQPDLAPAAASDPVFDAAGDPASFVDAAAPEPAPVEEAPVEAPASDFDEQLDAADSMESSVDDMFDLEG